MLSTSWTFRPIVAPTRVPSLSRSIAEPIANAFAPSVKSEMTETAPVVAVTVEFAVMRAVDVATSQLTPTAAATAVVLLPPEPDCPD